MWIFLYTGQSVPLIIEGIMIEELGADNTQRMWETLAAKTATVREERAKLAEKVSTYEEQGMTLQGNSSTMFHPTLTTVSVSGEPKAKAYQISGSHYKDMGVEPWDVVDTWPKEQAIGSYRAGALKYIMRAGTKGEFKEDIQKAQHYLQKLLEIL
jgi:Protein of unknwon function (DUF3310)